MEVADLFVVLRGTTSEFTKSMTEAGAAADRADSRIARVAETSRMLSFAVAGAALAVGAVSVKMASEFDAAMERVHTQAGASQAEVDAMKQQILSLAGPTAQAPVDLANALYHVESAGFRGATALSMVAEAAKGATIGNANLEDVTQAMIGVMASGLPDVHSAAQAMAFMNETVGIGDMKMQQLADAIGVNVLPTFKIAGLGMEDFSAALATLTDNATPANEVATRLRMTISLMAAPTAAAQKALKGIGLSQYQLADDMRKPNGLLVAVTDLKKHLDALGNNNAGKDKAMNALTRAFGGGRSAGSIETLIDEYGRLVSKYDQLGTAAQRARTYQDAWQHTTQTFAYQWRSLRDGLEAYAIDIGNALIPALTRLIGWVNQVIGWFDKHRSAAQRLGEMLKTFLVGALTVAAGWFADLAWEAVAAVGPFVAIAFAVGLLIRRLVALYEHNAKFHAFVDRIVKDIKDGLGRALQWLEQTWQRLWPVLEKAVSAFAGWIGREWPKAWAVIKKSGEWLADHFPAAWHAVEAAAVRFGKQVSDFLMPIIRSVVQVFRADWPTIRETLDNLASFAKNVVIPAFLLFYGAAQKVGDFLGGSGGFGKAIGDAIKLIGQFAKVVMDTWNVFYDIFTGKWSKLWNDAENLFRDAWRFILMTFLNIVSPIVNGAADAFGWIPGIGGKLKDAAKQFNQFKDQVNHDLSSIQNPVITPVFDLDPAEAALANLNNMIASVQATARSIGAPGAGGAGHLAMPTEYGSGHAVGGTLNRGWNTVGEQGAERIYVNGAGQATVYPTGQAKQMDNGAQAGPAVVNHFYGVAADPYTLAGMVGSNIGWQLRLHK